MIGEIDGGFSWEGKNKVVNLFFGQGWQKAGNGILRWTYQSAVSPWQGGIYLDFPPLLFAQSHLSYLFILLHTLPVKSQLENLTGNEGESCNIVFHCSSFVCSLKCAQIEQGTNVIEWNAIIANKWKSANPLSTILNLASKEKQQNNFFSELKCVFIVFSFSLCFLFHCAFLFFADEFDSVVQCFRSVM